VLKLKKCAGYLSIENLLIEIEKVMYFINSAKDVTDDLMDDQGGNCLGCEYHHRTTVRT
jgi:hypothetical protein